MQSPVSPQHVDTFASGVKRAFLIEVSSQLDSENTLVRLTEADLLSELEALSQDLAQVEPQRVASRVFRGLHDGLQRAEVDKLLVQVTSSMVARRTRVLVLGCKTSGSASLQRSSRTWHRELFRQYSAWI